MRVGALLFAAFAWLQTPAAPAGAISGVVVDSRTGQPVPGAVVTVSVSTVGSPPDLGSRRAQATDSSGRFVFRFLPSSPNYAVSASKPGYFPAVYHDGSSNRVAIENDTWAKDLRIGMTKHASVSGAVFDESGAPVTGAPVQLLREIMVAGNPRWGIGPKAHTDDRGMYRIGAVQSGRYVVAILNPQHTVPASTSALRLAGVPEPMASQLASQGRAIPESSPTLRLSDDADLVLKRPLQPASAPDGRPRIYRSIYYPDAHSASDATPIQLNAGDERAGVDLRLDAVPAARISGSVQGSAVEISNLILRLFTGGGANGDPDEVATTLVGENGRFTFLNVPAGNYTLVGQRSSHRFTYLLEFELAAFRTPGEDQLRGDFFNFGGPFGASLTSTTVDGDRTSSAHMPIVVDGRDLDNVVVPMRKGATISGRIVREGNVPRGLTFVRAVPARGDAILMSAPSVRTPAQDVDEFGIEGVLPGEYVLDFRGLAIKSVVWNGQDVTNRPFDTSSGKDITGVVATLTDGGATLAGLVRNSRGTPAARAAVIVFPVDRSRWLNYGLVPRGIRSVETSGTGAFRHEKLPADEYFVAAVSPDDAESWRDPGFLERIAARAARVTLDWDDAAALDLVVPGS